MEINKILGFNTLLFKSYMITLRNAFKYNDKYLLPVCPLITSYYSGGSKGPRSTHSYTEAVICDVSFTTYRPTQVSL